MLSWSVLLQAKQSRLTAVPLKWLIQSLWDRDLIQSSNQNTCSLYPALHYQISLLPWEAYFFLLMQSTRPCLSRVYLKKILEQYIYIFKLTFHKNFYRVLQVIKWKLFHTVVSYNAKLTCKNECQEAHWVVQKWDSFVSFISCAPL